MKAVHDWLMSVFQIDQNTSATIIITLFVFITGGLFSQLFSHARQVALRRRRRRTVFLNIHDLTTLLDKQAKAYFKFSNGITVNDDKTVTFTRSDLSQLLNLREIGYEKMFDAFFPYSSFFSLNERLRLKAFHKLWHILEITRSWHEQAIINYQQYLADYNSFNERRNDAIANYRSFIDPILVDLNGKTIKREIAEYVSEVDRIHIQWQSEKNKTWPDVVHSTLISPLLALNQRRENRNQIAVQMNGFLQSASLHYQNMTNLNNITKKQFFFYHVLFTCNKRILRKIRQIL